MDKGQNSIKKTTMVMSMKEVLQLEIDERTERKFQLDLVLDHRSNGCWFLMVHIFSSIKHLANKITKLLLLLLHSQLYLLSSPFWVRFYVCVTAF